MNSERIIVIVPGGDLPITSWDVRDNITTNWSARTPV